jgi:hypothetical protein
MWKHLWLILRWYTSSCLEKCEKLQESSGKIIIFPTDIKTGELPNMKQDFILYTVKTG